MIVMVKCIPALVSPIDTLRAREHLHVTRPDGTEIDPVDRPWAYTARIQFRFMAPTTVNLERAVKWISAAHRWQIDVPPPPAPDRRNR